MKEKNFIIGSLSLAIILGCLMTLLMPELRYTHHVGFDRVEITPTDARVEMLAAGSGNFLFFDVRSVKEYNELHATDSTSVPIADLYNLWEKDLPRSKEKQIYLICTSGRLAAVAYDFLKFHGFHNIKHIEGGVNRWIEEGQDVVAKTLFE